MTEMFFYFLPPLLTQFSNSVISCSHKVKMYLWTILIYHMCILVWANAQNVYPSPCPDVFRYEILDQPISPKYIPLRGVITVRSKLPIYLTVKMRVPTYLEKGYPGELSLGENDGEIRRKLSLGTLNTVTYHINYVKGIPVPEVLLIEANDIILCSSSSHPVSGGITNITWRYGLTASKALRPQHDGDIRLPNNNFSGNTLSHPDHKNYSYYYYGPHNSSHHSHTFNEYQIPFHHANGNRHPPQMYRPDSFSDLSNHKSKKRPSNTHRNESAFQNPQHDIFAEEDSNRYNQMAPNNETCGEVLMTTPLIVGGTPTRRGDWPWMVPLYRKNETGITFICSSMLISTEYVATAAHCVKGFEESHFVAYVGKFDITYWEEDQTQSREIEEIHIHPDYNGKAPDSDLAVLRLSHRVSITPYVNPVCFWFEEEDVERIAGSKAVVIGWGRDGPHRVVTAIPHISYVPIISQEDCLLNQKLNRWLSKRTLCAGNRDGTGPCTGDSGGGLLLQRRDNSGRLRWSLRAIVSSALPGNSTMCNLSEYVVFVDVAKYKKWFSRFIYTG